MNTEITPQTAATSTPQPTEAATTEPSRWVVPALDVLTRDSDLRLRVDLPGVTSDRLGLEVTKGVLTLTATRADRALGYRRQLRLPDTVDVEGIQARLAHGVLTLDLPAKATARPRTIEVKVG